MPEKIKQKKLQVVNSSMQMVSISRTQFVGLNDKKFYFHNGIVSLPFGHLLEASRKLKEQYKSEIKITIKEQKYRFLAAEAAAVKNC